MSRSRTIFYAVEYLGDDFQLYEKRYFEDATAEQAAKDFAKSLGTALRSLSLKNIVSESDEFEVTTVKKQYPLPIV